METNVNYQIRIKNHLDERWMRHFEGFEVTRHPNGEMVISGVMDQAALHGILNRIRDLRLELISLQQYKWKMKKGKPHEKDNLDHSSWSCRFVRDCPAILLHPSGTRKE